MTQRPTEDTTFVLLDGLRGLGALLVLMGHTVAAWGVFLPLGGAIVVDAFFVLSGFVLAYAYEPRFRAGMGTSEFMTHRLVRLVPLYLLGTALVYAVLIAFTIGDADGADRAQHYTIQLLPQLFLLPTPPALGTADVYAFNTPAYTLLFELIVNLAYVLAFRWLSTRVLVAVVVVAGIWLAIAVFTFGGINLGSNWATWWGGLPRSFFGFFIGVLGFRLVGSPRSAERPARRIAVPLVFALPLICFIPASAELRPFVDVGVACGLLLPLLMLSQSMRPPGFLTPVFVAGGQISYAIYILHQPVREVLERIRWRSTLVTDLAPWSGMAVMVFMIAVAWAAERYYDRPVRRAIVRWLRSRAGSATAQPSHRRSTAPRH
jgi:peptidoglycan/LPS O-acetylase OafA/YrhL